MTAPKNLILNLGLALVLCMLTACASAPGQIPAVPSPSPIPSSSAATLTTPPEFGTITGRVHLVSPPTPAMSVFALDPATGLWASAETAAAEGEATFSLTVPPGSYQVFAFSAASGYAAYTLDGRTLAGASVAAGQTVADIILAPPGQSECGSMFGVPASPDQRFPAVAGPAGDCAAPLDTQKSEVLPLDVPLGFETLFGLSGSFMLPPQFPAAQDLPAVQAYVLSAENEDYDISLDYGPECQGAGACHYGSLSGKKVASDQPESTPNFIFEAERAQSVPLAQNITGYYLEGLCGASCDDSRVFWVYQGYQYMLGLKGGPQQAVIDLANAAITNSIR